MRSVFFLLPQGVRFYYFLSPEVARIKIRQKKFRAAQNRYGYMKALTSRLKLHLNGRTVGFRPQTQKIKEPYTFIMYSVNKRVNRSVHLPLQKRGRKLEPSCVPKLFYGLVTGDAILAILGSYDLQVAVFRRVCTSCSTHTICILLIGKAGTGSRQSLFPLCTVLRQPAMQYCNYLISHNPDERKQRDQGQNL